MIIKIAETMSMLENVIVAIVCVWAITSHTQTTYEGTLCTTGVCKINETKLRFVIIGDWGGKNDSPYTTTTQLRVRDGLQKLHTEKNIHFLVSVGDHFYQLGVQDVNDFKFKDVFEDIYDVGKAQAVPWYLVGGNHDHYGNIYAQIEYSKQSKRWVYPNLSYVVQYELTPSNTKVEIVLVDTCLLCNHSLGFTRHKTVVSNAMVADTWTWLEEKLKNSKANYLFVAGHYPLYNTGRYANVTCLDDRFYKLLVKYDVTAYWCGHDHYMEYLQSVDPSGKLVHYILSGGGMSLDTKTGMHRPSVAQVTSLFSYSDGPGENIPGEYPERTLSGPGGFVYAEISAASGEFVYHTGDLENLYKATMQPRGASPIGVSTTSGGEGGPQSRKTGIGIILTIVISMYVGFLRL